MVSSAVDVVCFGLNATDTVIALASFPVPGSKVEYSEPRVLPGGQAATAAVALRRWGLQARYVGKLGDDEAAALHRRVFAEEGVAAELATVAGCASRQSLILIDPSGERSVLWRKDTRLDMAAGELRPEWIQSGRALLVDGYDTAAAATAARWARAVGIPVIADLDEAYPGIDELLPAVDYLIVSRDFPMRLTGIASLPEALKEMQARYGSRLTAATLGPEGVLAWDGARCLYRPAYTVPVADTTGAGDIFHAGFIYALLAEWELERQLDFASAAAALNCTAIGARGGIQSVAAIEQLMAAGVRYPRMIPAGIDLMAVR